MMENYSSTYPAFNETIIQLNIPELAKSSILYKIGKFKIGMLYITVFLFVYISTLQSTNINLYHHLFVN